MFETRDLCSAIDGGDLTMFGVPNGFGEYPQLAVYKVIKYKTPWTPPVICQQIGILIDGAFVPVESETEEFPGEFEIVPLVYNM